MKKYHGHPKFYKILDDLAKLHSKKNYQYASDSNPLANFQRAGALAEKLYKPGLNIPLVQAMSYMSKQIDGVYEMVGEGKKDTVEELNDKFMDIAIYSILCMILNEEKKDE